MYNTQTEFTKSDNEKVFMYFLNLNLYFTAFMWYINEVFYVSDKVDKTRYCFETEWDGILHYNNDWNESNINFKHSITV